MSRSRAICIGVLTGVLAIAMVACGGSDTARISKAQFLELANGICVKGNEEIEVAVAKESSPEGGKEAGKQHEDNLALRVVVPSLEKQVVALKKLGTPEGEEATVKIIVSELQNAISEVEHNPASFDHGNEGPLAKANKFAAAYGLPACAAQ